MRFSKEYCGRNLPSRQVNKLKESHMNIWTGLLFLGGFIATPAALAAVTGEAASTDVSPKAVVQGFLNEVRSGKAPEKSSEYLSEKILAHQMTSENETTVTRTPDDYAAHVKDFQRIYGDFNFEVTELLADGERVYARWKQIGCHIAPVDGIAPSGLPVVEIASAVYRVVNGKIVEYWIQIDRKGFETQVESNAANTDQKVSCIR
jgi:predicted ester cyclase